MNISLMNCSPFKIGGLGDGSLGMEVGASLEMRATPMILRMLELRSWRAIDGEHCFQRKLGIYSTSHPHHTGVCIFCQPPPLVLLVKAVSPDGVMQIS